MKDSRKPRTDQEADYIAAYLRPDPTEGDEPTPAPLAPPPPLVPVPRPTQRQDWSESQEGRRAAEYWRRHFAEQREVGR